MLADVSVHCLEAARNQHQYLVFLKNHHGNSSAIANVAKLQAAEFDLR